MADAGDLNKGGDGEKPRHSREMEKPKRTHRFLACATDGCSC